VKKTQRWRTAGAFGGGLLALAITLLWWDARHLCYVKSMALLHQFASPSGAQPWLLRAVGQRVVHEQTVRLPLPDGSSTRARYFYPQGQESSAPGVVLAHGVHHEGMDEPRLRRFATALASTGVVVFTPEISELVDYRIDPASVTTLGVAANELRHHIHRAQVGVMGLSFSGGLALLAASDSRYAPAIGFVMPMGAYDDLARVFTFLLTGSSIDPDGQTHLLPAHEYGVFVLAYRYVDELFTPEDCALARQVLHHWLWEERDQARALATQLSGPGQATLDSLFRHDIANVPALRLVFAQHQNEADSLSPARFLANLRTPVFLLHGAGDSVIPATETSWLARHIPAPYLQNVLISQAIQHVEMNGTVTWRDRWALIDFMAKVLQKIKE